MSLPTRPETVGVADEAVVPSYTFVSVAAVIVNAAGVMICVTVPWLPVKPVPAV